MKRLREWLYKFAASWAKEQWLDRENKLLNRIKTLEAENLGLREWKHGVLTALRRRP